MKKIALLSLFCCLCFAAFSQTAVTLWSTGAVGSFTTGSSTATTRTDNNITSTAATQRGYAVFDLTSIPAGSVINSCTIGFYVAGYSGSGVPSGWATYGYAGDLSTVTTAIPLFSDMTTPAATLLDNTSYGTAIGNQTIPSTVTIASYIQSHIGTKISVCFTGGATRVYTIKGENGVTTTITTANHAPYLAISYCPPPTLVSATAAPSVLCQGDPLTLTGAATGTGTLSWAWTGPSFTSSSMSPTLTTGPASSGVYSLTVTNICTVGSATASAVTPVVTVQPLPSPITGSLSVCTGNTTTLSSAPGGGSWTSNIPFIVSIDVATGVATGVAAGSATITYTSAATGCYVTALVTDNSPGGPVSGPSNVCQGSNIGLTDGVAGGVWSNDLSGVASVNPGTGVVTGNVPGVATISYTTGGCPAVNYLVTVNALPAPVTGAGSGGVCVGSSLTLADADPSGTWASSDPSTATVTSTGIVVGIAPGPVNITFTDPVTSCHVSASIVVNALPAAITGPASVCVGSTVTLSETTGGGTWSGGAPFANVTAATGDVTGVAAGTADVTFMISATACYATYTVAVNPLPAIISGASAVCQYATAPFTDTDPTGTWVSGNTAIATISGSGGVLTGVTSGIVNITYTLPTGCRTSKLITINPAPASIASATGPTTFCIGGNVTLNGSAAAGVTYQWNKDGTPIPGATDVAYTASTTGAFTISITNPNTCVHTSAVVNVVAGITGTLAHSTPLAFCFGNTVALAAVTPAVVGTITYQWDLNGTPITGANSSIYNAAVSGNYSCIINISGGAGTCSVISDTLAVTVNPLPLPVISYNGLHLSTAAGFAAYQWYLNTVSIPGATSATWVPVANGSYKVRVSDGNTCGGFSDAYVITNVGVNELPDIAAIKITPNPASTFLHIDAPTSRNVIITDVEGKVLIQQSSVSNINIAGLANGLYLISLYDQRGTRLTIEKFIKQ